MGSNRQVGTSLDGFKSQAEEFGHLCNEEDVTTVLEQANYQFIPFNSKFATLNLFHQETHFERYYEYNFCMFLFSSQVFILQGWGGFPQEQIKVVASK